MPETATSASSSVVGTARLGALSPAPSPEELVDLGCAQRDAMAQMVRQAKDAGIAVTGPNGLLKELTRPSRRSSPKRRD